MKRLNLIVLISLCLLVGFSGALADTHTKIRHQGAADPVQHLRHHVVGPSSDVPAPGPMDDSYYDTNPTDADAGANADTPGLVAFPSDTNLGYYQPKPEPEPTLSPILPPYTPTGWWAIMYMMLKGW